MTHNTEYGWEFYAHLWPVGRPIPLTFLASSSFLQELYGWAWQSNQFDRRYSLSSLNHFEPCPPGCICFLSCSTSTKPATKSLATSGTLEGNSFCVLPSQQGHCGDVSGLASPCFETTQHRNEGIYIHKKDTEMNVRLDGYADTCIFSLLQLPCMCMMSIKWYCISLFAVSI